MATKTEEKGSKLEKAKDEIQKQTLRNIENLLGDETAIKFQANNGSLVTNKAQNAKRRISTKREAIQRKKSRGAKIKSVPSKKSVIIIRKSTYVLRTCKLASIFERLSFPSPGPANSVEIPP
jgi:hypothetical protein